MMMHSKSLESQQMQKTALIEKELDLTAGVVAPKLVCEATASGFKRAPLASKPRIYVRTFMPNLSRFKRIEAL